MAIYDNGINKMSKNKKPKWAFNGKFITADAFEGNYASKNSSLSHSNDKPGCYIILIFNEPVKNEDYSGYKKVYVGQSIHVNSRVHQHLHGSHVPQIHNSYNNGKMVYICIIHCKKEYLDDLETTLIHSFNWKKMYNQKKGNGRVKNLKDTNSPVSSLLSGRGSIPTGGQTLKRGESIESVKQKAKDGDSLAQYKLGFLYEQGRCVPKDEIIAAMWYRWSAKNGNPEAAYRLSLLYKEGIGVEKNLAKAQELLALSDKLKKKRSTTLQLK